MILIIASCVDTVARDLLAELPRGSAGLLTPRDLSVTGWQINSGQAAGSIYVADGMPLESRAITGVVCRLPCVFKEELVHIEPDDRDYVAAEMTAFLLYWLSSLPCPKLNAPTAGCLSGPHWSSERWLTAAAAAGLKVRPVQRGTRLTRNHDESGEARRTVTVIGQDFLGDEEPELRHAARSLASAVGVDLLSVHFAVHDTGIEFAGANTFPDLPPGMATGAMWDFFNQGAACDSLMGC